MKTKALTLISSCSFLFCGQNDWQVGKIFEAEDMALKEDMATYIFNFPDHCGEFRFDVITDPVNNNNNRGRATLGDLYVTF